MPRWVSSPFQNFGSRLALVVRPTPNAVKFINIWLDLQLPGWRSNPWANFLGMPVPCLYLGMSYSNFRNLAQGLHNWWDLLQMRCHFSKHTIWASLLVSGRRSNPWAKLLEMPVACLCIGKSHSHSRTLAQCFLNQKVDPKCGRIPQNDEYEARSLTGDLILEPIFWECLCFAYAKVGVIPIPELWLKACISGEAHSKYSQIYQYLAGFAAPWTET